MLRGSSSAQLSGTLGVRDGPGRRGADRRMDRQKSARPAPSRAWRHVTACWSLACSKWCTWAPPRRRPATRPACPPARMRSRERHERQGGAAERQEERGQGGGGHVEIARDCTRLHGVRDMSETCPSGGDTSRQATRLQRAERRRVPLLLRPAGLQDARRSRRGCRRCRRRRRPRRQQRAAGRAAVRTVRLAASRCGWRMAASRLRGWRPASEALVRRLVDDRARGGSTVTALRLTCPLAVDGLAGLERCR